MGAAETPGRNVPVSTLAHAPEDVRRHGVGGGCAEGLSEQVVSEIGTPCAAQPEPGDPPGGGGLAWPDRPGTRDDPGTRKHHRRKAEQVGHAHPGNARLRAGGVRSDAEAGDRGGPEQYDQKCQLHLECARRSASVVARAKSATGRQPNSTRRGRRDPFRRPFREAEISTQDRTARPQGGARQDICVDHAGRARTFGGTAMARNAAPRRHPVLRQLAGLSDRLYKKRPATMGGPSIGDRGTRFRR